MADVRPVTTSQFKGFNGEEIAAALSVANSPEDLDRGLQSVNFVVASLDRNASDRAARIGNTAAHQLVNALANDPNVRRGEDGRYFYASGKDVPDRVMNELLNNRVVQEGIVGRRSNLGGIAEGRKALDAFAALAGVELERNSGFDRTLAQRDQVFERPPEADVASRLDALPLTLERPTRPTAAQDSL